MTMSTDNTMERPQFDPSEHPHRRFNPLLESYVLVSPHRTKRPWNGQVDPPTVNDLPQHDEKCYLCPGNKRMGGQQNPDYAETLVFPNDFPALLAPPMPLPPATESTDGPGSDLFQQETVLGSCQVICFHPRHDLTLARMPASSIRAVISAWSRVYVEEGKKLRAIGDQGCVQFFENRGSMMGASAPHPHGQVWSMSYVPQEPATELKSMVAYRDKSASGCGCMLCDYAKQEVAKKERVVVLDEENGWVAVVPWWATWPFEIMVLPYKRHISSILDMSENEAMGLSETLRQVMVRYDNLFSTSFPYSMGLHQAPLPPTSPDDPAHMHLHFYPPLLRSASVRKFLVGFELMGESQRDLTPEQAAKRLRELDEVHYLEKLQEKDVGSEMAALASASKSGPSMRLRGGAPLVDYASDSEDDDEDLAPQPPAKTQKRLPSLGASFALGPVDDPSLHGGRTRVRSWVPGEYNAHVFIDVTPNKRLREALREATSTCQNLLPDRTLHSSPTLHLSLTHSLPLRKHQIQPFMHELAKGITNFGTFHISAVGKMVGFTNSIGERAFLAIRIGAGHDKLEELLAKAVEPVLSSYRLPAYHRLPEFHASIAWTLGSAIPAKVLKEVNEKHEKDVLGAQPGGWQVDEIRMKIGNRVHAVELNGGGLREVTELE